MPVTIVHREPERPLLRVLGWNVFVVAPVMFKRFRLIPYRMTLELPDRPHIYRWLWWNWCFESPAYQTQEWLKKNAPSME